MTAALDALADAEARCAAAGRAFAAADGDSPEYLALADMLLAAAERVVALREAEPLRQPRGPTR